MKIDKKCLTCESSFRVYPYQIESKKYCSRKCYHSSQIVRISNKCLFCKKQFTFQPYRQKKYCSKQCQSSGHKKQVKKTCQNCKSPVNARLCETKKKFCSQKCLWSFGRAVKNCLFCNKTFVVKKSVSRKFCSKQCFFSAGIIIGNETDIEKILRLALEAKNIPHEKQYKIGKNFVDFAILSSRLVIEADGEYWHRNKDKDAQREKIIKSQGWRILRFSGTQIKKNIESCLADIQNAIL